MIYIPNNGNNGQFRTDVSCTRNIVKENEKS